MKFRNLSVAALLIAGLATSTSAYAVTVDVEIALLVDVSGSVSTAEFNLQRQGYVNAFNSTALRDALDSGRTAAVTFIYWASANQQAQAIDWTLLDSSAASMAFADAIAATVRPYSGNTAIGSAIAYATPLFASNSFESAVQIIDISGDGASNSGIDTAGARDAALAAGIDQINGLPILGASGLLTYYQENVQGGVGSFVTPAATFEDFSTAIQEKLGREIVNPPLPVVPEPATWAMMVLGFGAIGGAMRRRRAVKTSVSFA